MAKILYVVPDINFACAHVGLLKQLKERRIEFKKLKPGDVIVLLNRRESMLRVLAVLPESDSFGFLGSYRSPHGRVPLEAIKYIGEAFGGGGFDMNQSIRKGLEDLLGKKQRGGN